MSEQASRHSDIPLPFEVDPTPGFQYELLVGHDRTDGTPKSTAELQTEYIRLTDRLIHKLVDGVEIRDPHTDERVNHVPDFMVCLDKSARPLAWMTKELWPLLAADKDGNVPKMPEIKFVNIDRNQWTSSIDPQGNGTSRIDHIDPSIIRSLRSVFLENPNDRADGLTETIDTAPTQFDGKTVLIVDEVNSTGRTLGYAESFFQRAFPEANIAGTHWMGGVTAKNRGMAVGNADLPVWYSDERQDGRGVGNRNVDLSLESKNRTQKLGAWFLSTVPRQTDTRALQLRSEMHQLAQDARDGKIVIEPSRDRDDFEERALRLNHVSTTAEYVARKNRLHGQA